MKLTIEVPMKDVLELLRGLDIDEVAVRATDASPTEELPYVTRTDALTEEEATLGWKADLIYQPAKGKRRDPLMMAKGDHELTLKRIMTPEEEAEVEFQFENRNKKTQEAKAKLEQRMKAEEIAREVTAENVAEAAAETRLEPIPKPEKTILDTVPKVTPLGGIDQLFN
jgi:hypothetical protein